MTHMFLRAIAARALHIRNERIDHAISRSRRPGALPVADLSHSGITRHTPQLSCSNRAQRNHIAAMQQAHATHWSRFISRKSGSLFVRPTPVQIRHCRGGCTPAGIAPPGCRATAGDVGPRADKQHARMDATPPPARCSCMRKRAVPKGTQVLLNLLANKRA
jgi:hypothetical protein